MHVVSSMSYPEVMSYSLRYALGVVIALTALFLPGCCHTVTGPPGNGGALRWQDPGPSSESPTVIDCKGAERGPLHITKSNVTVRNCHIKGEVRIYGLARNANNAVYYDESRKLDYVTWIRGTSPSGTVIEDCTIHNEAGIPLYVGPGCTNTTIRNVEITGASPSVMVYLGAESYGTVITGGLIDGREAGREAVAIDASESNLLEGVTILYDPSYGGVFAYRNCGEAGIPRHTTPRGNVLRRITFSGGGTAVYWGSREGSRCFCDLDADADVGSGKSDRDHADNNMVENCDLGGGVVKVGEFSHNNYVVDD